MFYLSKGNPRSKKKVNLCYEPLERAIPIGKVPTVSFRRIDELLIRENIGRNFCILWFFPINQMPFAALFYSTTV